MHMPAIALDARATAEECDEVRPQRLHYLLRCRLPRGHHGDHRWIPELLPAER